VSKTLARESSAIMPNLVKIGATVCKPINDKQVSKQQSHTLHYMRYMEIEVKCFKIVVAVFYSFFAEVRILIGVRMVSGPNS
jgi:hypothetical protein